MQPVTIFTMKTKPIITSLAIALGAVVLLAGCDNRNSHGLKKGDTVAIYSSAATSSLEKLYGCVVKVEGRWLVLDVGKANYEVQPSGTILVNLDFVKWIENVKFAE